MFLLSADIVSDHHPFLSSKSCQTICRKMKLFGKLGSKKMNLKISLFLNITKDSLERVEI
jgi:hypothetical protein